MGGESYGKLIQMTSDHLEYRWGAVNQPTVRLKK